MQDTAVGFGSAFTFSLGDTVGPNTRPVARLADTGQLGASATANAQFGGSMSYPIRSITANYAIGNDDHTIFCNNAAGLAQIDITLPAPGASNTGRVYTIKRVNPGGNADAIACFVAPVDGVVTPKKLFAPGGASAGSPSGITVQSDGVTWWVISIAP